MSDSLGLSSVHISPEVLEEYEKAKRTHAWYGMRRPVVTQVDSVQWSEGGNVLMFKSADLLSKPPVGGRRSIIDGFSSHSRHRLLKFVNSIDRRAIPADRIWFVTLTYPSVWPAQPEAWKRHLQAFQKRLCRGYGKLAAIWKLEPQRRGAPHFHLLITMPVGMCVGLQVSRRELRRDRVVTHWRGGQLAEFRQWLSRTWFDVVGSGDEKHLRAGTNCEPLEEWGKVVAYAAKYLGKECVFWTEDGSTRAIGRYWGVWHRLGFPITWGGALLKFAAFAMFRRTVRRYLRRQAPARVGGRVMSATVFVPPIVIERLVNWLAPFHQALYQQYGSIEEVMRLVGFKGSVNDWFASGERERQIEHGEGQAMGRFTLPPLFDGSGQ